MWFLRLNTQHEMNSQLLPFNRFNEKLKKKLDDEPDLMQKIEYVLNNWVLPENSCSNKKKKAEVLSHIV